MHCWSVYLDDLNHDGELRVVEVYSVAVVSILGHHCSQQLDDIISLDITVVATLVVDCKLK